MDRAEAARLLRQEMILLAARPYGEFVGLTKDVKAYEVQGEAGVDYQVEISAIWSAGPGGPIQVLASIDDGSFRGALHPVTDGFLIRPDDTVEDAHAADL